VCPRRSDLPDVEEGLAERGMSRRKQGRIAGPPGVREQLTRQLASGAELGPNETDIPQSPELLLRRIVARRDDFAPAREERPEAW
jgi:hypothetical protein